MENEQAQKRFHELVWPQVPVVLRTAHVLCGGKAADGEDLAQETMLKAFRALDSFEPGTDIRAWLFSILRNARVDRIRSSASHASLSLDELAVEPAGPPVQEQLDRQTVEEEPEVVLATFTDEEVIRALADLPEEIRWTLLLVDVEGMSQQEAAAVLQVPVGTVKSRAHRGRMMLREVLLPVARQSRIVKDERGQENRIGGESREISKFGGSDGHA